MCTAVRSMRFPLVAHWGTHWHPEDPSEAASHTPKGRPTGHTPPRSPRPPKQGELQGASC